MHVQQIAEDMERRTGVPVTIEQHDDGYDFWLEDVGAVRMTEIETENPELVESAIVGAVALASIKE